MTLATEIESLLPDDLDNMMIICIGTDRSTGDSFGPLVGTMLLEKGFKNVVGTLHDTVHAMNLAETVEKEKGKFIFAIDACLGQAHRIGKIDVSRKPIKPGQGVNKDLPEVGDIGLYGVVNIGGFMEYHVLQCTRLSLVMDLAKKTTDAILTAVTNKTIQLEIAAAKETTL